MLEQRLLVASIPLPDEVNFAGVQLKVLNTQKNFTLFAKSSAKNSKLPSR